MNDDDLMTAMRDRFAAVRMRTPEQTIIARGTARRRRRGGGRLAAGAAGALAISLGAGLSVPALTAGPSATATPRQATLAAWTVQKHSDGSIGVTIRRPQDLAALQVRLAALGALVIFETGPAKQLAHGCPLAISLPRVIEFKPLTQAVAIKIQPGKIPAHAVLRIALPAGVLRSGPGPRSVSIRDVPVPRALVCQPLTPIARAR